MTPISNARAATDTRHRIAEANSQPRAIKVVGLGEGGAALVAAIDTSSLRAVQTLTPAHVAQAEAELPGAEMIFIVLRSGDDASLAPEIKRIARAAKVMITGILLQPDDVADSAPSILPVLRAASDMLIVTSDPNYVVAMLAQLGA